MEKQKASLKEMITKMEVVEIINALNDSGWVKARAARRLNITERMIGYKIKKYGIRRDVGETSALRMPCIREMKIGDEKR